MVLENEFQLFGMDGLLDLLYLMEVQLEVFWVAYLIPGMYVSHKDVISGLIFEIPLSTIDGSVLSAIVYSNGFQAVSLGTFSSCHCNIL